MSSLVDKLAGIADAYYIDSDNYKEIEQALIDYELHKTDLNSEAVLWLAALYTVPIEKRIEWVAEMRVQLESINEMRRSVLGDATSTT